MEIIFDRSFSKSLDKLKNKSVKKRLISLIDKIENISSLSELPNVKKLEGFKNYYRVRIGDYRLGIELENDTIVRFIIVSHRKDIYKLFP